MLFFYLRHGDPVYEPNKLTPLGHRQAEALARRLAMYGLDEIYMSSSNRAMQTAVPTCELLKKEATILDWTSEEHAWEEQSVITPEGERQWLFFLKEAQDVLTSKEIRNLGMDWYTHPYFKDTDFSKGHLRIRKQTREFFKELGYEWDEEKGQYKNLNYGKAAYEGNSKSGCQSSVFGKRVALFAHHCFGTNFFSALLNIPMPEVCLKMNFCHTGMTVFYFDDNNEYIIPQMLTMGNDGHLLMDNLPTRFNNEIFY